MVPLDYTPQQVADLLQQGAIELIDVREPDEWEAGRIGGARHLALAQLPVEAHTVPREKQVVFYCRSGARSAMATEGFSGAGWDAHNMSGGLLEWEAAGLPLEPAGGRVADS